MEHLCSVTACDIRVESKTEVAALRRDVCFASVSGHRQAVSACPLCAANTRHLEARGYQLKRPYSVFLPKINSSPIGEHVGQVAQSRPQIKHRAPQVLSG